MKWTEEKISELRNLIEEKGLSKKQVAKKMVCSLAAVEHTTKEKIGELKELLEKEKLSYWQAAKKMGTSRGNIAFRAMQHGIHSTAKSIKRKGVIDWTQDKLDDIKKFKIAGYNNYEIADILSKKYNKNISYDTIRNTSERYRLTMKYLQKDKDIPTYEASTIPEDNYLVTCDYHSPYHSELWINRSLEIARKHSIKKHIIIGDLFDFNALKYWAVDEGAEKKDLDGEILHTEPVIEVLDYFDKNILLCGNHERRVGMKTDSLIQARHLFGLFGAEIWKKKFKYSVYDKLLVGDKWMMVHPRSYSQISTSVAKRLAEKYHKNIINAHGHFVGMAYDRSGKFLAIDLGGMFDTEKIDYLNLRTTTHPNWKNGFGMLYNGRFYLFNDETDWDWWLNQKKK